MGVEGVSPFVLCPSRQRLTSLKTVTRTWLRVSLGLGGISRVGYDCSLDLSLEARLILWLLPAQIWLRRKERLEILRSYRNWQSIESTFPAALALCFSFFFRIALEDFRFPQLGRRPLRRFRCQIVTLRSRVGTSSSNRDPPPWSLRQRLLSRTPRSPLRPATDLRIPSFSSRASSARAFLPSVLATSLAPAQSRDLLARRSSVDSSPLAAIISSS